jgi:hypothetical protein
MLIALLLGYYQSVYAESNDSKAESRSLLIVLADMESANTKNDLEKWTDQRMIGELSKIDIMDNDIKALYIEFKNIAVSPPNPDNYKEYGMVNGEKTLENIIHLGRKIHNMLFAISDKNIERYGNLLHAMRDALYIDSKCIPFVIKHDNSRDAYWYSMYNKTFQSANEAYKALFNNK